MRELRVHCPRSTPLYAPSICKSESCCPCNAVAYRQCPDTAHADPPNAEQAEAHYQQALALAEALGMRPLMAHCHRGLGTLYAQYGRREEARIALSAAIALYRAMEMTFWLPETEVALAQVEGQ